MRQRSARPHGRPQSVLIAASALAFACVGGPAGSSAPASGTSSATAPPTTPSDGTIATPTSAPTPLTSVSPSPTQRPTAEPTPPPTARPTPRPTATPAPPGPSTLVAHGPRAGREVALTFDMGGRVGDALAIVRWLVDHDVRASIFMTGAMADNRNTDAGREVLAVVDAHPGLFTLGNHSYTHRDFRTLTEAEILDELHRTEVAVAPHCRQDLRPFFRPPFGGHDTDVLSAVGTAGYGSTVMWDIDTIDWRPIANDPPGPTADQIVSKVLTRAQGGSIVLMHLGGYETLAALPRIVSGLTDAGYDLVRLDDLLD